MAPGPLNLIAIGRLRGGPEAELFERYNIRLRPRIAVTELPEARGSPAEVKRRESAALLSAVPRDAIVIALDSGGQALDSQTLAAKLEQWLATGHPVCFLMGGAEGLGTAVLNRADYALSFGAMTWPHFLARAMLAEQIYRARSIAAGHPYHRDGRPGA